MSIALSAYQRKSFTVEAVQVTQENMREVAKWCGGTIAQTPDKKFYVALNVANNGPRRIFRAYMGYWVVLAMGGRFMVYPDKSFNATFEPEKPRVRYSDVLRLVKVVVTERDATIYNGDARGTTQLCENIAREIYDLF